MEAIAAIIREAGGPFSIEPIEIQEPRADEILVRIAAVGICHSDVAFASGAMGSPLPMVFGHEGAGVVLAIGTGVTSVVVGDKVLLTFDSCGACSSCSGGNPAYCRDFNLLNLSGARRDGSTSLHQHGVSVAGHFFSQSSFASHALAHERNIVKLPDDADLTTLAPLGCGIQTGAGAVLRSLKAAADSTLVVLGGGAVGLGAVMAGGIAGCASIILIEPHPERRALGLSLGAHHAIDPAGGDTTAAVRALIAGGVDNAIDTSGHIGAIEATIGMLAPLGKLGLIGLPRSADATLALPIVTGMTNGLTVRGILEGDSDPAEFLPELIAYHAAGRLPIDRLIKRYRFDQINEAVDDTHHGTCVKAVLVFD